MAQYSSAMKIVPADATIAELEKKAAEYDRQAEGIAEPLATRFKEKAALFRESALKGRKWTS